MGTVRSIAYKYYSANDLLKCLHFVCRICNKYWIDSNSSFRSHNTYVYLTQVRAIDFFQYTDR
jgi:hypothetical protein